ncbi:MAG: hypothetical protein ACYTAF_17045 [Planctomycetota bacterium]|jgi:hypothetical protein
MRRCLSLLALAALAACDPMGDEEMQERKQHIDEAKKKACEMAAVANLRHICMAELRFREISEERVFGTLDELYEQQIIGHALANATTAATAKTGYYYVLEADYEWFTCVAFPAQPGKTGDVSFYIDDTGIVRYAKCVGENVLIPNEDSPELEADKWPQ